MDQSYLGHASVERLINFIEGNCIYLISSTNVVMEEAEKWLLDDHKKEEYESKLEELNTHLDPIMAKLQPEGGMPDMGGMNMGTVPEGDPGEPTIDEVD